MPPALCGAVRRGSALIRAGAPRIAQRRRFAMNATVLRASAAPYLQALLRIMTGLLFLEHGTGKLLGFPVLPGIERDAARPAAVHRPDGAGRRRADRRRLPHPADRLRPLGLHGGRLFHGPFPDGLLPGQSTMASWRCSTASSSSISPPPVPARGRSTRVDPQARSRFVSPHAGRFLVRRWRLNAEQLLERAPHGACLDVDAEPVADRHHALVDQHAEPVERS